MITVQTARSDNGHSGTRWAIRASPIVDTPNPIRYKPGRVEIFEWGLRSTLNKEAASHGIGKNYDRYRATWVSGEGFKFFYAGALHDGKLTHADFKGTEREEKILRFQLDILDAVKNNKEVAMFVEQYGREIGLL